MSQTLLMVLESEKELIPVSSAAFDATQSSKRDLQRYNGALIISRKGESRRIQKIEVTGLWGSSFPRKILSALTSARAIKVHFDIVKLDLDEFKALVIRFLGYDQERDDPYLPLDQSLGTIQERVKAASNFAEVFQIINVPTPENALDVL